MKYIKIFLASSIDEFAEQRKDLGDYIRSLNDIYVRRGIYFEYEICENLSNAVSKTRKQDEYNEKIRKSDYFYLLFGSQVGAYTEEEFDVALEQFQQTGLPRIYTYFQKAGDEETPEQSVKNFMERLDKQLGHYYVMFKEIDSVKLNILLELVRNENLESKVSVEDGKVMVEKKEVLSVDNIPFFNKNEFLMELKKQKIKLDEEFMRLRLENIQKPDDEKVFSALLKVNTERDEISDRLRQEENEMLCCYKDVLELGSDGKPLTVRAKKAKRLLEDGDYQGALAILNDIEREKELAHAEAMIEDSLLQIKGYIFENQLKIAALQGQKKDPETLDALDDCYRKNAKLAEKYQIEWHCIYDYAFYLFNMHRFAESSTLLDKYENFMQYSYEASDMEWIDLYLLKGNVYSALNELRLAERYLRKSAQLAENLDAPDTKATIYNNYANICMKRQKAERAETYYRKALECCEDQESRDAALIYGDLAHSLRAQYVVRDSEKLDEIRRYYLKAYDIEEKLNKDEATKDPARLAEAYLNLADYCFDLEDPKKAEGLYKKALECAREAAKSNPAKYSNVAQVLRELSFYYDEMDKYDVSEPLCLEALEIIKKLSKQEPDAYEDIYASLCQNYGYILVSTGRKKESIRYYETAIKLYQRLIEKGQEVYRKNKRDCELSLRYVRGEIK